MKTATGADNQVPSTTTTKKKKKKKKKKRAENPLNGPLLNRENSQEVTNGVSEGGF